MSTSSASQKISPFWFRLFSAPRSSWRTGVVTLGFAGLWGAGIFARTHLIPPFCAMNPNSCTGARVPPIDRMSLGLEWSLADGLSYWLQNFSIAAGPVLILAFSIGLARVRLLRQFSTDMTIWLASVLANGALMEWTRITFQRIRPFVYKNPVGLGDEAAHYTSFYSGHTSFVAASWTALLWIAFTRTRSAAVHIAVIIAWMVLPVLTGYFRIFSGRHFLSDALIGGLMGVAVATAVAWTQRSNRPARHQLRLLQRFGTVD